VRVVNRHTARVAEIAPGEAAEVDESNPGVKVFLEAGLLVDAATVEHREPELTLDQAKAKLDDAARAFDVQREDLAKSRDGVSELAAKLADARARVAELEAENKQLAAVAETNASELGKAHEASRKLVARIAELEAQLSVKAESSPAPAPAAEPTSAPEAPVKKGKG
jgi:BMFP domain-containing protein YqiC